MLQIFVDICRITLNDENLYINHLIERYGLTVNASTAGEILQRPQKFISELIKNGIIRGLQCLNKNSIYKDCPEKSANRKYQISVIELGRFLSKLYATDFPANFGIKERKFLSEWYKFPQSANFDDYQVDYENNEPFKETYFRMFNKLL